MLWTVSDFIWIIKYNSLELLASQLIILVAHIRYWSGVTWTNNYIICFYCSVSEQLRHVQLCNPWTAAYHVSLSFTISLSLLKLMSVDSVMPSNHLILCCPLLLPSLFPSIGFFSKELALCIRWSKYWEIILHLSHFFFYISINLELLLCVFNIKISLPKF